MFTDNIEPIISNGVSTIGKKYLILKYIGTVIWYWSDDKGQLHTNKLNNLLYFQDSLVKILNATEFSESVKDDEGTYVPTKRKYSIFTWYFGKYKRQYLTPNVVFYNRRFKLDLASFLDFAIEWDQY